MRRLSQPLRQLQYRTKCSAAMSYMFGTNDGNSPHDIANSKLVVMFGNNPAETRMSGGGVTYYVENRLANVPTPE